MRKNFFCMLLLSGLALSTTHAAPELNIFGAPNPSSLCMPDTVDGVALCKEGELMFFSPSTFGNEQLPLIVISFYCDTSKPLFFNKSGVICFKNASPRVPIDPVFRDKTERWNAFRNSVIRPDSGWIKQSDTVWVKIVKSGSGELPPPNTKIVFAQQDFNVNGEKEGEPYENELEVTEDSNFILQYHPLGSVLHYFKVEKEISESKLWEITVKSFIPIKEKKQRKSTSSAEKAKADEEAGKTSLSSSRGNSQRATV